METYRSPRWYLGLRNLLEVQRGKRCLVLRCKCRHRILGATELQATDPLGFTIGLAVDVAPGVQTPPALHLLRSKQTHNETPFHSGRRAQDRMAVAHLQSLLGLEIDSSLRDVQGATDRRCILHAPAATTLVGDRRFRHIALLGQVVAGGRGRVAVRIATRKRRPSTGLGGSRSGGC